MGIQEDIENFANRWKRRRKSIMTDYKGNELNIGDEVVYVCGKNSYAGLETGKITKFYKNHFGEDECSVDGNTHILSHRIMKLN